MSSEPWTIPFNNTVYVCWRDKANKPHYRPMTEEEDKQYFTSPNKEKFLNELLHI